MSSIAANGSVAQGESFTGALDAIFTRQKASSNQRSGSINSNKSRKRNEEADSQNSRTLSEKSYSSVKKDTGQISDGSRRYHYNSISKEQQ